MSLTRLMAWVRSKVANGNWNDSAVIAGKRNGFILHPAGGGTTSEFYTHTTGPNNWLSTGGFSPGTGLDWRLHVGTYDSSLTTNRQKYYIDGVIRTQTNSSSGLISVDSDILGIGHDDPANFTTSRYLDGYIDEFALFDQALEADQHQAFVDSAADGERLRKLRQRNGRSCGGCGGEVLQHCG